MKKFMVIFVVFLGVSCSHMSNKYSGQIELNSGRIIQLENATIMSYQNELYISDGACDSSLMSRDVKTMTLKRN